MTTFQGIYNFSAKLLRPCEAHSVVENIAGERSLADKVGVSRLWVVEIEKGKSGASIGLLLRTIGALGIALDAEKEGPGKPKDTSLSHGADAHMDIDSIVASARRKGK